MAISKENNKNLIIGICTSVGVIAIIAIIVVVLTMQGSGNPLINDNYFVTDDSKYVITLNEDQTDESVNAIKTHIVYNYSGDDITSVKYYYEYADESAAKSDLDGIKEAVGELYKDIEQNGKYIILTLNDSDFENMTADDVQQQIEFMEMIQNISPDETTEATIESSVSEEEVVPETPQE